MVEETRTPEDNQPVVDPGAVQEPETPAAPSPDEAGPEGEPAKPEIPEKYRGKSVEEIARMHQEAEERMHQATKEASDYRRILESITPMVQNQFAPKEPEQSFDDLYAIDPEKAIQQAITRRAKPFEDRLVRTLVDLDRERTRLRYGEDFEKNKPEVERILQEMPELTYRDNAYETGYLILKGRQSNSVKAQGKEEGKKEAYETIKQKKSAFVEGAGKSVTHTPTDSELMEEAIKTGDWTKVIQSRIFPK